MPTPQADESQEDFVSRCIPVVLEDGTAEDQEQAAAVCYSMWREAREEGKMTGRQMERKTFSGIVTKADEEQGVVEAFFAVFGNVDQGNDIVHPGAFAKTFAERGGKVKVLDNHQTDSIMRAIGKPLVLKEVGRDELPGDLLLQNPDATGGAFARVQMLMDTPEGKGAFVRLRDKAVTEWSFGYDALDFDFSTEKQNGGDVNVRNLRQVKLYEISPVLFGMNAATTTVSAKSDGEPEAEDDKQSIEFGEGKYLLVVKPMLDETTGLRLKAKLNEWIDNPDDKAFLITGYGDVKLIRLHEQPIIHNHYNINTVKDVNDVIRDFEVLKALAGRAGPDDAPPPEVRPDDAPPTDSAEEREKALRNLRIMAAELQLSEDT